MDEQKTAKKKSPAGLLIPGGLFIGMGIGFLTDALVPWMFIGLGAGFIALFVFSRDGR